MPLPESHLSQRDPKLPPDIMSLVAGPGRGGVATNQLPDELKLVVDKHVAYIQSLDTVRFDHAFLDRSHADTDTHSSAETSSSTT